MINYTRKTKEDNKKSQELISCAQKITAFTKRLPHFFFRRKVVDEKESDALEKTGTRTMSSVSESVSFVEYLNWERFAYGTSEANGFGLLSAVLCDFVRSNGVFKLVLTDARCALLLDHI